MLDMVEVPTPSEPLSLNPSPVNEKDLVEQVASASTDSTADEDTTYDPTPYEKVGFRITTPPPTFWKDDSSKEKLCHHQSTSDRNSIDHDPATAMRRRQFAVRRQSTIGAMIWAEKYVSYAFGMSIKCSNSSFLIIFNHYYLKAKKNIRAKLEHMYLHLWQYRLWSFQTRCTKLERFLPKVRINVPIRDFIEF